MSNQKIPILIITCMAEDDDEYWKIWGFNQSNATWIFKDKPFNKCEGIGFYDKGNFDWDRFIQTKINIPPGEEIIALIIDGCSWNKKPHQLEIVWHLANIEKCNIDIILIHPGGGQRLKDALQKERFNDHWANDISFPKDGKIMFPEYSGYANRDFNFLDYSLQKVTDPTMHKVGEWIKIISKAVKEKDYKCSIDRLKELKNLLDKCKNDDDKFDEKILLDSSPIPCPNTEIIKELPNLFLPILLDLNGLRNITSQKFKSLNEDDHENNAIEYLKEILADKKGDHCFYRKILANTRFLTLGEDYISKGIEDGRDQTIGPFPNEAGDDVKTQFNQDNLAEIIKTYGMNDRFLKLLGFENQERESPGFPLMELFYQLDSLGKKYATDEGSIHFEEDVSPLANTYESFKTWYDQLCQTLGELKEKLSYIKSLDKENE
jgi:hypothetical protein